MRKALVLPLFAALLAGCASDPANYDINGTWINQAAIDAAANGGNLREALLTYGPNLEWEIDTRNGLANYSNGFERVEGKLVAQDKPGHWTVDFYGSASGALTLDGKELIQAAGESEPEQPFVRASVTPAPGAPLGSSFEQALYKAYLGGNWKIVSGPGAGGQVQFQADGHVAGLGDNDRYALCLAGDCASMSGEYDSMWLEKNENGRPWIFVRTDKQLEILQAVNTAQPDEMPQLRPGERQWLLEKQ